MNPILPEFLEQADGEIRITGHRISLFRIIDTLFDGVSFDRLREMFPSVAPDRLREVVDYCNQNLEWSRNYHAERLANDARTTSGKIAEGPSLAELRERPSGSTSSPQAT
jgi:uncharacterized protein (DUF433 family)